MKVCSWNVNSVRQRAHPAHDRLTPWLKEHAPDVVCLQELQCTTAQFPHSTLHEAGYQALLSTQKGKNGVALLTRLDGPSPAAVAPPWPPDAADAPTAREARFVAARVDGVVVASVYVPYGRAPSDPQWQHKLRFLQQLKSWCQSILESGQSLLLAGDFNVAPSPEDASCQQDAPKDAPAPLPQLWAPWCHPQMRAALGDLLSVGLTDLGAAEARRAPQWTMWDERNFGPDTQLGVRVDLLLGSLAMEARLLQAGVHSSMRQGIKPSDHVPVYGIFRPVQRIFGALSGSRLYGLATARSDTDIKGLMLPSPDDLLLGQVQKVEHLQRRKNAGEKNNALDVDVEFYSPTHFVSLLLAGQPMAWELLYAPPACHTPDTTPVGLRFMARLREHSDRLWCQNLSATLGFVERHVQSYLRRQMGPHKAPVATFVPGPLTPVGEHGKLLSHALRVLQQAQEMFDTGTMIFPRANAVQLRQIKEGQGLAQGVLADIDAARATLLQSAQHSAFAPHPDHGLALGLVRDLHDRHLAVSRWLKAPPRLLAVDGRPLRQRPPGPSALLQALSLEGAPQSAALEQIL